MSSKPSPITVAERNISGHAATEPVSSVVPSSPPVQIDLLESWATVNRALTVAQQRGVFQLKEAAYIYESVKVIHDILLPLISKAKANHENIGE